jgi:hypothetical protein
MRLQQTVRTRTSETCIEEDENADLFADSHNILNRWKNYFSQVLNVHRESDVKNIEKHTAEPLVTEPSPSEVEVAIAKLNKYKSPELIQAGGGILLPEIRKLIILFGVRKNCLSNGRSLLRYQFTRRATQLTVLIIERHHCYQLHIKFYPISFSLHVWTKLLGSIGVGFDVTDQL